MSFGNMQAAINAVGQCLNAPYQKTIQQPKQSDMPESIHVPRRPCYQRSSLSILSIQINEKKMGAQSGKDSGKFSQINQTAQCNTKPQIWLSHQSVTISFNTAQENMIYTLVEQYCANMLQYQIFMDQRLAQLEHLGALASLALVTQNLLQRRISSEFVSKSVTIN